MNGYPGRGRPFVTAQQEVGLSRPGSESMFVERCGLAAERRGVLVLKPISYAVPPIAKRTVSSAAMR
jgi:hypothetical protein